jgi:membrane-associated phospholipid phosphatase
VGLLAVWAFAALTQDVLGHDDLALRDPQVESWVVAHRTAWLTSAMKIATWLGSNAVLVPLLVAAVVVLIARLREWRRAALLVIALAGAIGLYDIVKPIVGRSRPPAALWIGQYDGPAFPSGHATQAVAFYGMLAIVLMARRSFRLRALLWSAAALVCLAVGASRIYLGAHWFTDVLAGCALGVGWVALVLSVNLLTTRTGITVESPADPDRAEFGDRRPRVPDRQRASSEGSRAAP